MRRRHRPAAGQLMLLFVAALGDPAPPPLVARGRCASHAPRIDRAGDPAALEGKTGRPRRRWSGR